jgi:hypothetical protein
MDRQLAEDNRHNLVVKTRTRSSCSRGVSHGDIAPRNVIVCGDGSCQRGLVGDSIDFNIAVITGYTDFLPAPKHPSGLTVSPIDSFWSAMAGFETACWRPSGRQERRLASTAMFWVYQNAIL